MSDRSDEVTRSREPHSTEDLLAETDELLSGETTAGPETQRDHDTTPGPAETDDSQAAEQSQTTDSRLSRFRPSVSRGELFSPKAFLAFLLLFGVGIFAGSTVIPVAGGPVGVFTLAFLAGLLTSKRRYLEVVTGGALAGGATALLTDPMLAIAGSMQAVLLVGVAAGVGGSLLGYYFGRDLRDGLARDVE